MGYAADLVNAGYTGYQGWSDANAMADFQKTNGVGKSPTPVNNSSPAAPGGSNSSSSMAGLQPDGSYVPFTAPDLSNLRNQAYGIINPYYQELAKQAKGDFNTAVQMMTADYQQGQRQAKETLAYQNKYGGGELQNALSTLGLTFNTENQNNADALNKRGMAVYQNNPNGNPNVIQGADFNPSFDTSNYTYNTGISGPNPNLANLGQGGNETEQLRQSQALRAEATARAGMKPLEQAGISFKQQYNPNSGFDPNNPAASTQGADLSKLGTGELGELKNYNTQTQQYRNQAQQLSNQQSQDINNLASQYAGLNIKSIDSASQNQLQKQYNTNFINSGLT